MYFAKLTPSYADKPLCFKHNHCLFSKFPSRGRPFLPLHLYRFLKMLVLANLYRSTNLHPKHTSWKSQYWDTKLHLPKAWCSFLRHLGQPKSTCTYIYLRTKMLIGEQPAASLHRIFLIFGGTFSSWAFKRCEHSFFLFNVFWYRCKRLSWINYK